MIYIVTGWARSGTSLMMHLLKNIGIPPFYSEDREKRFGNINPYFYEHDNTILGFERDDLDNCAIKVLVYRMHKIKTNNNIKVIFMYRDIENKQIIGGSLLYSRLMAFVSTKYNTLIMDYDHLIDHSEYNLKRLELFLEISLDINDLKKEIKPELRHTIGKDYERILNELSINRDK